MVYMVSYTGFDGPLFYFRPWPDPTMTAGPNSPLGNFWGWGGVPINEKLAPRRLVNSEDNRTDVENLPQYFMSANVLCVDDVFKAAVESIEPGKHQFIPLTLEDQDGSLVPRQYYMFNVIGRHDAVRDIPAKNPVSPFGLWTAAIPKALIPPCHCWKDIYTLNYFFMSEEMVARLKAAVDVKNLQMTVLEEI